MDKDGRMGLFLMTGSQRFGVFSEISQSLASRTGQLLNLSNLANECGISHNTARSWISVMEASFLVHLLEPHHRNFKKRLVKSPKLYFVDPGLAAWLLGIQTIDQLSIHPHRGALFESWVVSELLKGRYNRGIDSNLYFWRDKTGHEIDVVIDEAGKLRPIEIKSGRTLLRDFFRNMDYWMGIAGKAGTRGMLIYAGDEEQRRSQCDVIPWNKINDLEKNGVIS